MYVLVGRVGRAHGIRGDVAVDVRTDAPDTRLAPESVLATDPAELGPLTVAATRWHSGRLLVAFEGVADRSAAEGLRGAWLLVDTSDDEVATLDPDEWFDHQLVGLAAVSVRGVALGTVDDVIHLPGGDLLSLRHPSGGETLVPFVAAIVPEVDLETGRVVVDPPAGLLELGGGV